MLVFNISVNPGIPEILVSWKNGWIPYIISNKIMPTENTSHLVEYFYPIKISIGKYKGVPYQYKKNLKKFI